MTIPAFRSGGLRVRAVVWLFVGDIVIWLVSIWADFGQIELLRRMAAGAAWTMAEAEANDSRIAALEIINGVVYIIGVISFLFWLYRVRANLPALGIEDARWGPGWAVGWWFVPIMNLVRPLQVVWDIWQACDPVTHPTSWRDRPMVALLGWWWALLLIGGIADNIAFLRRWSDPGTIIGLVDISRAYIVANALAVIGAVLAIKLVTGIDRRQKERHAALVGSVES